MTCQPYDRKFSWLIAFVAASIAPILPQSTAFAQSATQITSTAEHRARVNRNTVTILGASLTGSYIKIVDDIAKAVNDGHRLRVLPILGEGGSQNIRDIIYLKGVDAGIVMSTSLEAYKKDPLFWSLRDRLHYIAKLYHEEMHVVARPNILSIRDLKNKRIAFHGGALVSGQLLFDKLGIRRATSIKMNFYDGLDKLKTGEIDAIVRATASPMKDFNTSFDPKYHKLVPIKFQTSLIESYAPTKLTNRQYPKVILRGQPVETVAIGVVLAAFAHRQDTDRYRRVAQFVDSFFSNFEKLLANKKRHRKWDETNLAGVLPGWQRFPAAQEWLDRRKLPLSNAQIQQKFEAFMRTRGARFSTSSGKAEVNKLFEQFLKWQRQFE